MSFEATCQSLQTLINIHEELCEFSKQKTEIIKDGSVEEFQKLLAAERKYIERLSQAEKARGEAVQKWCEQHQLSQEEMTITHMLEIISDPEEKDRLEQLTIKLTNVITELKQQEQLNHELIQQSMQFVQLSLDMLNPTINHMNYGEGRSTMQSSEKRSVFDSRA